jgi:hypothetical protein
VRTRNTQFARLFAVGMVASALAAPLTASADLTPALKGVAAKITGVLARPDPTPLPPPPPEAEQVIRDKAATFRFPFFPGPAVSGLETVPGTAARIRYLFCDIYYSRATGAHEVHGDIRAKYNHKGGPWSSLGLPTTDQLRTDDLVGRYNNFSGAASIYWSPDTGPMVVRGDIRSVWQFVSAEQGPLGYPTADERDLGAGRRSSDFQNDVIYWDGSRVRTPEIASLTPAQLQNAVRNFLVARGFTRNGDLTLDSISIREISDTGHGFLQSRNRLVTFRVEGEIVRDFDFDPNYTLDLRLLFFAQKEANGSTTLRVALDRADIETSGFQARFVSVSTLINGLDTNRDVESVVRKLSAVFPPSDVRPKLVNLELPAAVNVLSVKVQKDGSLKVYLQPDLGGALGALALQRELDTAAK